MFLCCVSCEMRILNSPLSIYCLEWPHLQNSLHKGETLDSTWGSSKILIFKLRFMHVKCFIYIKEHFHNKMFPVGCQQVVTGVKPNNAFHTDVMKKHGTLKISPNPLFCISNDQLIIFYSLFKLRSTSTRTQKIRLLLNGKMIKLYYHIPCNVMKMLYGSIHDVSVVL